MNLISFEEDKVGETFLERLNNLGTKYYDSGNTKRFIINLKNVPKLLGNEKIFYGHESKDNREIDYDRVDKIEEKILNSNFECRSSITIGLINWENPKIIDGQHRFSAYLRHLDEENKSLDFVLINFDNEKNMKLGYIDINSGKQVDQIYLSNNANKKKCCEFIANQLFTLFSKKINISNKKNYVSPYLEIGSLSSALFDKIRWDLYDESKNENNLFEIFKDDLVKFSKFIKDYPAINFPVYNIDPLKCISKKSMSEYSQCPHPRVKDNKCLTHFNSSTLDCNPKMRRSILFKECGSWKIFMYVDYEWIDKLMEYKENNYNVF